MPRIRVIVDVIVADRRQRWTDGHSPDANLFRLEVDQVVADLARRLDFREDLLYGRHVWPRPVLNESGNRAVDMALPAESGVLLRGTISRRYENSVSEVLGEIQNTCAAVVVDLPLGLSGAAHSQVVADVANVRTLHALDSLHSAFAQNRRAPGKGVAIAIVDSGLNLAAIQAAHPDFGNASISQGWSWSLNAHVAPGTHLVGHGTMCACDALIGAPNAELIDIAVIHGFVDEAFESFLSDVISGYLRLLLVAAYELFFMRNLQGLVISNSWTVDRPDLDYPAGHPLNYHSNPSHPICALLDIFDWCGADNVFSAGNSPSASISGAAAKDTVLTVSSVDLAGTQIARVSRGPGTISPDKPDLAAATSFCCSNAPWPDGGTSASCAVAAGAIAAARTVLTPYGSGLSPRDLRAKLLQLADPFTPAAPRHDHGVGILKIWTATQQHLTAP